MSTTNKKPLLIVLAVAAGLAFFFCLVWLLDTLDSTYKVKDLERNGRVFAVFLVGGLAAFLIYKRVEYVKARRNRHNGR